ncbi:receptor-type tyrosine-protein phosphatase U [Sarotherodon galilaeus]
MEDFFLLHKRRSAELITMADCKLLGLVLAIVCFLGSIITCVLPMWRVTPFIGSNIVTSQTIQEGLWKWELGSSLYIGWGSAGLLFLGGGLLCSSCPRMNDTDCEVRYSNSRPV